MNHSNRISLFVGTLLLFQLNIAKATAVSDFITGRIWNCSAYNQSSGECMAWDVSSRLYSNGGEKNALEVIDRTAYLVSASNSGLLAISLDENKDEALLLNAHVSDVKNSAHGLAVAVDGGIKLFARENLNGVPHLQIPSTIKTGYIKRITIAGNFLYSLGTRMSDGLYGYNYEAVIAKIDLTNSNVETLAQVSLHDSYNQFSSIAISSGKVVLGYQVMGEGGLTIYDPAVQTFQKIVLQKGTSLYSVRAVGNDILVSAATSGQSRIFEFNLSTLQFQPVSTYASCWGEAVVASDGLLYCPGYIDDGSGPFSPVSLVRARL